MSPLCTWENENSAELQDLSKCTLLRNDRDRIRSSIYQTVTHDLLTKSRNSPNQPESFPLWWCQVQRKSSTSENDFPWLTLWKCICSASLWEYNSSNEAGATTWGSSWVDPRGGGMHRPHVLPRRVGGSRANYLTQQHSCKEVAHGPHPGWALVVLVCFCFVLVWGALFLLDIRFFFPIGV